MEQRILNTVKEIIPTLFTAIIEGALFKLIHIPILWLLGPMIAVLIGTNIFKRRYVASWLPALTEECHGPNKSKKSIQVTPA